MPSGPVVAPPLIAYPQREPHRVRPRQYLEAALNTPERLRNGPADRSKNKKGPQILQPLLRVPCTSPGRSKPHFSNGRASDSKTVVGRSVADIYGLLFDNIGGIAPTWR